MDKSNQESNESTSQGIDQIVDKFKSADANRAAKLGVGAIILIALIIASITYMKSSGKNTSASAHKEMGLAYVYFSQDKYDSVSLFLQNFLNESRPTLVKAKALSLLGKAEYLRGNYTQSLDAYNGVNVSASEYPILASGALYGQASSLIQLGDYQGATEKLSALVDQFKKRTGDPKLIGMEKEKADLSPAIPEVLLKLALCYQQLGQAEKAIEACNTLLTVYSESSEAKKAKLMLAQLS